MGVSINIMLLSALGNFSWRNLYGAEKIRKPLQNAVCMSLQNDFIFNWEYVDFVDWTVKNGTKKIMVTHRGRTYYHANQNH
jgi:hypothetical protein